jgi:hypothetical protein
MCVLGKNCITGPHLMPYNVHFKLVNCELYLKITKEKNYKNLSYLQSDQNSDHGLPALG